LLLSFFFVLFVAFVVKYLDAANGCSRFILGEEVLLNNKADTGIRILDCYGNRVSI
jgi:hypothetical protein